jgi:branched-subunit amino acid transport protein
VSWAAILLLAAGTFALKATGPVVLGDRPLPIRIARLAELLPAALLAALVAVNVAGGDRRVVVDARLAGFVAAVVAVRLKASFLVVVVVGCAATALARAAGG